MVYLDGEGGTTRSVPQAHGHSETALFTHRHFAFKTPSLQLSIKTQQTKDNSKNLKPQTHMCYLGGSLGRASDNTASSGAVLSP